MDKLTVGPLALSGPLWEVLLALGIILLFALLARLAGSLLARLGRGMTRRTRNHLPERLTGAASHPAMLLLFVQGLYLAAASMSALDPWSAQLATAWSVAVVLLMAVVLSRLVNEFMVWYGRYGTVHAKGPVDRKLVPPVRRFLTIAIYVVAAMAVLDQMHIAISPLVAGLGIGGLAVALALQPTLGNFFAGTYLVSDNVVSAGDFIELENGLVGYVTEIGWRSTRIRTPFNNLVVIPNSRLSDSILTNYYGPSMEIGVVVNGGVSYESDLDHVQRVALEVAAETVAELPEAVKSFEPWFGYEGFGESNVDFWLWVQARDRPGTFRLKSEIIRRLHKRFREEGIEINYPVRRLVLPDGADLTARLAADSRPEDGAPASRPRRTRLPQRGGVSPTRPPSGSSGEGVS